MVTELAEASSSRIHANLETLAQAQAQASQEGVQQEQYFPLGLTSCQQGMQEEEGRREGDLEFDFEEHIPP